MVHANLDSTPRCYKFSNSLTFISKIVYTVFIAKTFLPKIIKSSADGATKGVQHVLAIVGQDGTFSVVGTGNMPIYYIVLLDFWLVI